MEVGSEVGWMLDGGRIGLMVLLTSSGTASVAVSGERFFSSSSWLVS